MDGASQLTNVSLSCYVNDVCNSCYGLAVKRKKKFWAGCPCCSTVSKAGCVWCDPCGKDGCHCDLHHQPRKKYKSAYTRKGAASVGPSLGVPSSSRQAEKTPTYVNDLDLDGALSKHDKKVEFEKKKGQQVMVASFYGSLTVNVPRRSRTNIPMLSALDQPKKVSPPPPEPPSPPH